MNGRMHTISVRTMSFGLMVGIVLLIVRGGICGDNYDGSFVAKGYGGHSCGRFIQESKQHYNKVSSPYATWVTGYLTAVNIRTPDTYDIAGATDLDGVMLWIENYCNKNTIVNI